MEINPCPTASVLSPCRPAQKAAGHFNVWDYARRLRDKTHEGICMLANNEDVRDELAELHGESLVLGVAGAGGEMALVALSAQPN